MAQMNWGDYAKEAEKTGGFTLLPIGPHNVKVDTAEVKPGKSGHNQILARLVVTDGPSMGGSILNNMAPFKNNGDPNGFFFQGLAALGLGRTEAAEWWAQLDLMDVDESLQTIAQAMLGREATITVDHAPYNNVMRDNVKKMAPKGAPMPGLGVPGAVPVAPVGTAAPAPAAPVAAPAAAAPVVPATTAAAVQPLTPAVTSTGTPAVAPAPLVAPPAPATDQPAPAVAPPAAPAVAPPTQAPVAPVVPPVVAGEQGLVRPDEAPF